MKTIITIGRQFGSGGKEVGIRVAKELYNRVQNSIMKNAGKQKEE